MYLPLVPLAWNRQPDSAIVVYCWKNDQAAFGLLPIYTYDWYRISSSCTVNRIQDGKKRRQKGAS